MAPSTNALSQAATAQAAEYVRLQQETRSLIAAQNSMVRVLGLQKNSIVGSIANVVTTTRENLKILQLKLQERKALESQIAFAKRKAEFDRREMELRNTQYNTARSEYLRLAERRRTSGGALPSLADEVRFRQLRTDLSPLRSASLAASQQYNASEGNVTDLSNRLAAVPGKSMLAFTAGANILKAGVNVASVAFGVISGALKGATSAIINFMNGIKQIQLDFGLTMSQAAKLQFDTIKTSVENMIQVFKTADFTGLGDIVKDTFSALFNFGRNISGAMFGETTMGNAGKLLVEQLKLQGTKLTAPRPIESFTAEERATAAKQLTYVSYQDLMTSMKSVQDEFGVFNKTVSEDLARTATQRGVSVESLIRARRIFATQTLGDYNKVEGLQNRFVKVFEGKGMTIRTAMESIGKYAELLARNGTRFADSFARAAADAKKIGVDLNKVDQIGDNIIGNFEGFLESQAELGAMGFGFDTSRLAEIAITGDTGALATELRSQLASTGKDLTQLNRAERQSLESAFGMNISKIQRMISGGPEETSALDLQEENNSILQNVLNAMYPISDIAKAFQGPIGIIAAVMGVTSMLGLIYDLLIRGFAQLPGLLGGNTFREELSKNYLQNRELMQRFGITVGEFKQSYVPNRELAPSKYMPYGKATGGYITGPGTETSDSIPARLSDGEYVVKASAVKKPGVKELLDRINHGNESVLMKARGGLIGKLMGGFSTAKNLYSTYNQTGIRGVGSQLLGQFGNRIPGLSTAMNVFSVYKSGGIGGALKSVAKGGIGKLIGGAIGSAIPIPGIGTAIGSLMGSKVGKLVGGLFGRKKKPVAQQIMGALPELGGFAGNLMGRIPGMERFNTEAMFRGMAGSPQAQQAVQAVVDTTGIEQKLNNFINALNNMNIVMDGAKVGKVLVNVTDAASTVGVFRSSAQATL